MNTQELSDKFPKEYAALPEPYQNDDCLEFIIDNGVIYCRPDRSQVSVLGNWVSVFDGHEWIPYEERPA